MMKLPQTLLLLTFSLVVLYAAAVHGDEVQAPLGLQWGMTQAEVESKGIQFSACDKSNWVTLCVTKNPPKPVSFGFIYVLTFFAPNHGLVAVRGREDITEDSTGRKGKELYTSIKTSLTKKYGEPGTELELVGAKPYDDPDEFYQCLAHDCGFWGAVWEPVGDGSIGLELDGHSRGKGFVQIDYVSKERDVLAEAHEQRKAAPNCEGDCQNGYGTYTFLDGGKYVGEFKDNHWHGQGTHTWPDGRKYVGEFKDGKPHSQGTLIWPDGEKYVGEFKDDKRHGQGTLTWPNGQKYVGEYKGGKSHGQGTHTWPNGQKYVGEFKDDKKYGEGTITYPDGEKYVGEFKDGKPHGQGTLTWPNGQKYAGEFKDDKRHGQGTSTWPDGKMVVGEWKNDKRQGRFTLTLPSGHKLVVLMKDDKIVRVISTGK